MKPRVRLKYKHWIFKLPWMKPYSAICLGRTVYFREDQSKVTRRLLSHEMVHQEQISRHGAVLFYLIYLYDYWLNLIQYRSHRKAYLAIRFEKEAFEREQA